MPTNKRDRGRGDGKEASGEGKVDPGGTPKVVEGPGAAYRASEAGVYSWDTFGDLLIGLMTDVVQGRISPAVCNAACNASGKLIQLMGKSQQMKSIEKSRTNLLPVGTREK